MWQGWSITFCATLCTVAWTHYFKLHLLLKDNISLFSRHGLNEEILEDTEGDSDDFPWTDELELHLHSGEPKDEQKGFSPSCLTVQIFPPGERPYIVGTTWDSDCTFSLKMTQVCQEYEEHPFFTEDCVFCVFLWCLRPR